MLFCLKSNLLFNQQRSSFHDYTSSIFNILRDTKK